jgi:hypothetical protein
MNPPALPARPEEGWLRSAGGPAPINPLSSVSAIQKAAMFASRGVLRVMCG